MLIAVEVGRQASKSANTFHPREMGGLGRLKSPISPRCFIIAVIQPARLALNIKIQKVSG